MRCIECGRETSSAADRLCAPCALRSEREVDEMVGETTVARCHVGDGAMEIKGLPERTRIEDTTSEHADPAVPGSIQAAPDVDEEILRRYAGGGGA